MSPRGFNTALWIELMWNFLWILIIPVAMTLLLLTLTVLAEVISRATDDPHRRNKVSTFR